MQAVSQGHIYLPMQELTEEVKRLLLIDIADFDKYIMDLAVDRKIVVKEISGQQCVYASIHYYTEASVARLLTDLDVKYNNEENAVADRIARIENKLGIELDPYSKKGCKYGGSKWTCCYYRRSGNRKDNDNKYYNKVFSRWKALT